MPVDREEFVVEATAEPKKKSALPWVIGCLVALVVLPGLMAVLGLVAAIAIPSFVQARNRTQLEVCLTNLQNINRAKELAAIENAHTNGTPVTMASLSEFLAGEKTLTCPQGGTYRANAIGEDAECSAHDPTTRTRRPCCPAPATQPPAAPASTEGGT